MKIIYNNLINIPQTGYDRIKSLEELDEILRKQEIETNIKERNYIIDKLLKDE